MNGKKSFILYMDMRQPLQTLTDEERGKLLIAMFDYAESRKLPEFNDNDKLSVAFAFVQQTLDRDAAKWDDVRHKRAEAGRKGGKQTQANRANANCAKQTKANQAVNVSGNVSVNDTLLLTNNAENPTAPDAADPTGPRPGGGNELNSAQLEYVTQILKAGKPATPEQFDQLSNLGNGGAADEC